MIQVILTEQESFYFTEHFQKRPSSSICTKLLLWNVEVEIKLSLLPGTLPSFNPHLAIDYFIFLIFSCTICKVRKLEYVVSLGFKIQCPRVRIHELAIHRNY